MPPEELAPTNTRPLNRRPYRGNYYVAPDGSVEVWNGTQYVPRTTATLAPEALQPIERERDRLRQINEAASLGSQFLALNSQEPTGSVVQGTPGLSALAGFNNPRVQQMQNIQDSRVFDYMRGGAAGGGISPTVANTPQEQARLERVGPTIANLGPTNRSIVLRTQIDRDLQMQRLIAMEEWARNPRNRGLDGFEQYWTREGPRLRARIQQNYETINGPLNNQATRWGEQRRNPAGSVAGGIAGRAIARQGQQEPPRRRLRYNPETGDLE